MSHNPWLICLLAAVTQIGHVIAAETPDAACRAVLETAEPLTKCGFLTERSGIQYYWLEFDRAAMLTGLKADPNAPEGHVLGFVIRVPMYLMMAETTNPLASVRTSTVDGKYVELTRAAYNTCVQVYGDPVKILKTEDNPKADALSACLFDKIYKARDK